MQSRSKIGCLTKTFPYGDTHKRRINILLRSISVKLPSSNIDVLPKQRRSNSLINKFTDYKTLLSKYHEITIHQRNLQVLMTQIYKIKNMSPLIMSFLFAIRENIHYIRHFQVLFNENRRIINHGFETMCYVIEDPPFCKIIARI